jgi:membrane protease YdiL (CAAX protease family)
VAELIRFIGLTYGLTWLMWLPTALLGSQVTSSLWLIPYLLGGFGPSLAALILTARQQDDGPRWLLGRLVDWRRISPLWYLFIFLVFPLIIAVVVLISQALGLKTAGFAGLARVQANPVILIGLLLLGVITGPLSEELGWRGYALDRLQERWGPIIASLILAPIHWAWHLPLFFIEGSTQAEWGLFSQESLFFLLALVPLTILMTWVYNHNQRSILAAVLLHFTYNFTLGLVYPIPTGFQVVYLLIFSAVTLAVAAASGSRTSQRV